MSARIHIDVIETGIDLGELVHIGPDEMRAIGAEATTLMNLDWQEGVGADGRSWASYAEYSTRPIAIHNQSEMGRRLLPKGGKPFYHEPWMAGPFGGKGRGMNPFKLYLWMSKQKRKPGAKVAGRLYEGGYAEYKRASRKGGIANAEVDLVLSGQLLRSVGVKRVLRDSVEVAPSGDTARYGTYVQARRPFIGISPKNMDDLAEAALDIITAPKGRGKVIAYRKRGNR